MYGDQNTYPWDMPQDPGMTVPDSGFMPAQDQGFAMPQSPNDPTPQPWGDALAFGGGGLPPQEPMAAPPAPPQHHGFFGGQGFLPGANMGQSLGWTALLAALGGNRAGNALQSLTTGYGQGQKMGLERAKVAQDDAAQKSKDAYQNSTLGIRRQQIASMERRAAQMVHERGSTAALSYLKAHERDWGSVDNPLAQALRAGVMRGMSEASNTSAPPATLPFGSQHGITPMPQAQFPQAPMDSGMPPDQGIPQAPPFDMNTLAGLPPAIAAKILQGIAATQNNTNKTDIAAQVAGVTLPGQPGQVPGQQGQPPMDPNAEMYNPTVPDLIGTQAPPEDWQSVLGLTPPVAPPPLTGKMGESAGKITAMGDTHAVKGSPTYQKGEIAKPGVQNKHTERQTQAIGEDQILKAKVAKAQNELKAAQIAVSSARSQSAQTTASANLDLRRKNYDLALEKYKHPIPAKGSGKLKGVELLKNRAEKSNMSPVEFGEWDKIGGAPGPQARKSLQYWRDQNVIAPGDTPGTWQFDPNASEQQKSAFITDQNRWRNGQPWQGGAGKQASPSSGGKKKTQGMSNALVNRGGAKIPTQNTADVNATYGQLETLAKQQTRWPAISANLKKKGVAATTISQFHAHFKKVGGKD